MSSSTLAVGLLHLRSQLAAQLRSTDSDEQLLHDFTTHRDESAFAVLLRRHGPMVLHVCRRVLGHEQDTEDAFQATFLVLVQGSASLRNKTALASWLYGTAYRIALKAKQSAMRRRKYEKKMRTRPTDNPAQDLLWSEVQTLLDEEIARLPQKYRIVFVLCCLEELSQTEAAHRLGVKIRTVSNRLAEARKRLAQQLRHRGVELAVVLTVTGLAAQSASALSPELMTATFKAALATAAGEGLTRVVSASVAKLAKDGAAAVMVSKVKLAVLILMAVTLLGCASAWAYRHSEANALSLSGQSAGQFAAKVDDKPAEVVTPKSEAARTVEIQGRVLGTDGKPKAGAKLLLLDEIGKGKIIELGVTVADGRFTVAVPKQAKGKRLIAWTDDTGFDFLYAAYLKPGKPAELRLVNDRPIRGQIVSTEGKPVAGVRVAVRHIEVYPNNSLDSFLVAWAKRHGNSEMPDGVKGLWSEGAALFAATTDAEGRFVIRGIGSERVVLLHVSGPGIASTERWVINRDGFDAKPYNQELRTHTPRRVFYGPCTLMTGPDMSIVAEREMILRGVVKDAETGKGIGGATIWMSGSGERAKFFSVATGLSLKTQTDATGRFEIRGVHKEKSYLLQVRKNPATGYLDSLVRVPDTTFGYEPITADVPVKKGVIVTGKIIDRSTGKTVPGDVNSVILNGNPFLKDYTIDGYPRIIESPETGKDGTFREVVIPGPVLLTCQVDWTRVPDGEAEVLGYKRSVPDPQYPQYFQVGRNGDMEYLGSRGIPGFLGGNACKVLDTKPGTAILHQDFLWSATVPKW